MIQEILIDIDLPGLNEYIQIERSNRFKAANLKKKLTNDIALIAIKSGLKLDGKYDIEFIWTTKDNRHDHDNVCFAKKFILDGLVKGGVLQNDTPRFVNNFRDLFKVNEGLTHTVCNVKFYLTY